MRPYSYAWPPACSELFMHPYATGKFSNQRELWHLTGVFILSLSDCADVRMVYSVIHLLVVDVSCVLFLDHARWLGPKQNTQNIYQKRMNNRVSRDFRWGEMPGKELRKRWLEDSLCMLQLAQIGRLKNVQWYFERIRSVRNRVTEHLLSSGEKVQPVVCNRENHNLSLPHKDVWSILAVFCSSEF